MRSFTSAVVISNYLAPSPGHLGDDVVKMGQRLARIRETANGRYKVTFERASGTSDVIADFVVLGPSVCGAERARHLGGGLRRSQAPGHCANRAAAATASCISSSASATGWVPDRGPACPTAPPMPTPATRSAGKRRARKAATSGILVFYSGGSRTDAAAHESGVRQRQ